MASDSGKQGESYILPKFEMMYLPKVNIHLQIRVSPLPFLKYKLL